MELLSLDEYTQMAKKFIKRYGNPRWLRSDEYISIVIDNLVRSDRKYKDDMGATLNTFRVNGFKNSRKKINTLVAKLYKDSSYYDNVELNSIRDTRRISHDVDELLDDFTLTKLDKKYLTMVFKEGMKQCDVAKELNVTRQAVSIKINEAINKLRKLYGTK